MTRDGLIATGERLYGDGWVSALAVELNVAKRSVERWASGERAVPEVVERYLAKRVSAAEELRAARPVR